MSAWRSHVSEDTKVMIKKLSDLNSEVTKMTDIQRNTFIIFIMTTILMTVYFIIFMILQLDKELSINIATFFNNNIHIVLLFIPAYFYFKQSHSKSKIKSAKEKLENLRYEVIDHLKSPWFQYEHSSVRDEISKEMESININVRFKSIS